MRTLFALMAVTALAFTVLADVDKSVCALPKVEGTCRAFGPRYYYNADSKECEFFVYGGCSGNENRFASIEACTKACL